MHQLQPAEIADFLRRFRFRDARLLGVRTRYRRRLAPSVDILLLARTNPKQLGEDPRTVRLRIRLTDVDEYRLQKRPSQELRILSGVEIGYFQGQFYFNLDPWEPGEGPPALHEIRASEAYFAGSVLEWEAIDLPPISPSRGTQS